MNHPVCCPNRRRPRHALTLVDMVVAVTIMGIAAAVAVPRISESVALMELRSAVSICMSDMEYLRRQAVVQGRKIHVKFDEPTSSVYSSDIDMPGRALGTYTRSFRDYAPAISMVTAFQVETLVSRKTEMSFDYRGDIWVTGTRVDLWAIQFGMGKSTALVLVDPMRTTSAGI